MVIIFLIVAKREGRKKKECSRRTGRALENDAPGGLGNTIVLELVIVLFLRLYWLLHGESSLEKSRPYVMD